MGSRQLELGLQFDRRRLQRSLILTSLQLFNPIAAALCACDIVSTQTTSHHLSSLQLHIQANTCLPMPDAASSIHNSDTDSADCLDTPQRTNFSQPLQPATQPYPTPRTDSQTPRTLANYFNQEQSEHVHHHQQLPPPSPHKHIGRGRPRKLHYPTGAHYAHPARR